VPPAYQAPEASHWVSTSRSAYVKPTDLKAPERYIGPGKTLVKEPPKSAFVGTVESGHFRSRYQVDFGSQPGRRPTFETATTHDLDIGTPRCSFSDCLFRSPLFESEIDLFLFWSFD
jgi:hypothetical protein